MVGLVLACLAWGALRWLSGHTHRTVIDAAIASNQAVFTSNADAAQGAFTGLEVGVIAVAVAMAVGCVWGLSRRLAEYR
jgi:hypothetical protein